MKSYFADILKQGVPRCSKGCQTSNLNDPAGFKGEYQEHLPIFQRVLKGSTEHLGTPHHFKGVLLKARDRAKEPLEHSRTPKNNELSYLFEERASIVEYDGRQTREQAEFLALTETAVVFLESYYPELFSEFYQTIGYIPQEHTHDTI